MALWLETTFPDNYDNTVNVRIYDSKYTGDVKFMSLPRTQPFVETISESEIQDTNVQVTRLQLQIEHTEADVYDRISSGDKGQFTVEIRRNGSREHTYVVNNGKCERTDKRAYNSFRVVGEDLTILKSSYFTKDGSNERNVIDVGGSPNVISGALYSGNTSFMRAVKDIIGRLPDPPENIHVSANIYPESTATETDNPLEVISFNNEELDFQLYETASEAPSDFKMLKKITSRLNLRLVWGENGIWITQISEEAKDRDNNTVPDSFTVWKYQYNASAGTYQFDSRIETNNQVNRNGLKFDGGPYQVTSQQGYRGVDVTTKGGDPQLILSPDLKSTKVGVDYNYFGPDTPQYELIGWTVHQTSRNVSFEQSVQWIQGSQNPSKVLSQNLNSVPRGRYVDFKLKWRDLIGDDSQRGTREALRAKVQVGDKYLKQFEISVTEDYLESSNQDYVPFSTSTTLSSGQLIAPEGAKLIFPWCIATLTKDLNSGDEYLFADFEAREVEKSVQEAFSIPDRDGSDKLIKSGQSATQYTWTSTDTIFSYKNINSALFVTRPYRIPLVDENGNRVYGDLNVEVHNPKLDGNEENEDSVAGVSEGLDHRVELSTFSLKTEPINTTQRVTEQNGSETDFVKKEFEIGQKSSVDPKSLFVHSDYTQSGTVEVADAWTLTPSGTHFTLDAVVGLDLLDLVHKTQPKYRLSFYTEGVPFQSNSVVRFDDKPGVFLPLSLEKNPVEYKYSGTFLHLTPGSFSPIFERLEEEQSSSGDGSGESGPVGGSGGGINVDLQMSGDTIAKFLNRDKEFLNITADILNYKGHAIKSDNFDGTITEDGAVTDNGTQGFVIASGDQSKNIDSTFVITDAVIRDSLLVGTAYDGDQTVEGDFTVTGDSTLQGTITGDNTIGKSLTVNESFHSKGKIKVGQDVAIPSYAAGIIKPDPTDALSLLVVEGAQAGEKAGVINSLAGTGHMYEYSAGEFDFSGDGSYDTSNFTFRSRTNDGWADPIRIDINSDDSVQAVFNGGSEAGTNASLLKPLFKDGLIAEDDISVSGNTTTSSLDAGILSIANNGVGDTSELSVGYNQDIRLTTGSFGGIILDPANSVNVASYLTVGNGAPGFSNTGTQIEESVAWFDDVNVRGSLFATEFEVRKIDVARGEKIFGPGGGKITELFGDQTYDAKWQFEEETGIQVGDVLLIKEVNASDKQIAKEVYAVAKEVSDATKTVKVNINGTESAGSAEVGDDVAVIGSSDPQRDSLVYLNPFGPYIDVLDGIGSVSDWQSRSPNVRMGNLDGTPTLSDGTNPTGRGFYASGNAYLEGTVVADSGELGGWTIEDNVIKNPDVNGTGATITIGQRNSSWYGYHIAGPNGVETYNQINRSSGRIVQGLYANGGADKIEWGNESGVNGGLGIQIVANNNFILRTDEDGTAYVDNLEVRSNATVGGTQASNLASQSEIFSGDYSDLSGTPSIPDGALAELDKINDTTLIGNGVIITDMIASDAIVSDKIAANAVTATQIGVGSVKDIDSNAAVASDLFSGDYSDLSGTPTLGTLSSLDKITDSTYIGDGVIVTSKIAVDTALANDILAKNASITNTLTMGTSGEITNSGGDWSVDSDGFTVQQGTYRRNSYDIVDSTNSRVATFSANSNNVDLISDNGTMAVRSDEKLTLNSINGDIRLDPQFGGKTEFMGTSSIKAEMKPYDGDTNSVSYKGMMLVFNNPIPESNLSDSLVRENLNIGEGAISAISFSDGNVNLLWMERDENDNVFYDWIF